MVHIVCNPSCDKKVVQAQRPNTQPAPFFCFRQEFGEVMRRRYVKMSEETVSRDNKLDLEHAHVKTWNGKERLALRRLS